MAAPLLPCECVAGMTTQYQLAYIYEALRQLSGSAALPSFQCALGNPMQTQLAFIYCAALAWSESSS